MKSSPLPPSSLPSSSSSSSSLSDTPGSSPSHSASALATSRSSSASDVTILGTRGAKAAGAALGAARGVTLEFLAATTSTSAAMWLACRCMQRKRQDGFFRSERLTHFTPSCSVVLPPRCAALPAALSR